MEKLYSISEIEKLGILPWRNRVTILRKLKAGSIAGVKVDGRWYVTESAIKRYMYEGTNQRG